MLTPVMAYLKIREKDSYSFLLESVEGIGRWARYSFLGKNPSKVIYNTSDKITVIEKGQKNVITGNIFQFLKEEIKVYKCAQNEDLPDFTGGIVGYLGYENIALIEDVIKFKRLKEIGTPDSIFAVYDTIIVFDHYKHQLILITNVFMRGSQDFKKAYHKARAKLKKLRGELIKPAGNICNFKYYDYKGNGGKNKLFVAAVKKAKANIFEGEVFQLVLSKRFNANYKGDLFNVYRALRIINPSPYMYFLELAKDFTIIGTSPEDLLKVKNGKATILPIAGTRKRGRTKEEDIQLEKELLSDEKEKAEHIMLVDLARNDLGRICKINSIDVTENMKVRRYSHVMHIVSKVEGMLAEDKDCIDALMSAFPAGTLTGAPKIRAIQLIDKYEQDTRNVYGGAVGYIDFSGNLDMCIAIRTLFAKGKIIFWQAGAGIVADSDPVMELKEVTNKSAVLINALKYAEVINEDLGNR